MHTALPSLEWVFWSRSKCIAASMADSPALVSDRRQVRAKLPSAVEALLRWACAGSTIVHLTFVFAFEQRLPRANVSACPGDVWRCAPTSPKRFSVIQAS